MEQYIQLARTLYPNMPEPILNAFAQQWSQTGDPNIAIAEVRKSNIYQDYFPGNITPTGQVRYDEVTYQGLKESYIGTLAEYGIPRATSIDLLEDRFVNLIEGEVSAREFQQRISGVYQGIQENLPEVQSFYATNYGIDLTPEAIFMGALDPTIGEEIVAGKITTAQIGGEAKRAGFDISLGQAERLRRAGLTQAQARELFTTAEAQLPRLQEITARTEAGQDPITLQEYTEAAVFGDPDITERIQRLGAAEESMFSPVAGAARRGSRVTGIVEE